MKNSSSHASFYVERDRVRHVPIRRQILAAPLQLLDERDRLPVQRRVLGGRRGAQVRLQRDVAEILQRENAELVGMADNSGDGQPNPLHQLRHVRERQIGVRNRTGVQRQDGRGSFVWNDPEVFAIGRVAGERDHARVASGEPALAQISIDPTAYLEAVSGPLVHFHCALGPPALSAGAAPPER